MMVNKGEMLEFFRSADDKVVSFKRQDDKVRVYGNVAVATFRCKTEEIYKGQKVGGDFRLTRIFVKRNHNWLMVSGQQTRISTSPTLGNPQKDKDLSLSIRNH